MNDNHYTKTLSVNASPEQAYTALTKGFEHWWTRPDAPIINLGDRARFTFPPGNSYWTFEASALEPYQKVELNCVEALHLHEGQPAAIETEWLGSRLIFEIQAQGNKTSIRFVHLGLKPTLLCYNICESGWDFFFLESLKCYLDTGTGKPHKAD